MTSAFDLLARGLFPRELPPCFSSRSFAEWTLDKEIPATPATAELGYHNLARVGSLRRHLGVPNPLPQARLARVIDDEWFEILMHVHASPYSLTTPNPTDSDRAIEPTHPLSARVMKRAETRAGRRFLVRADVAQFYHSIYPHAVAWAAHTRDVAKDHRNDQTLWGNRLDRAQQAAQHRQTIGIPIGPDTSLILAEVMLTPVDRAVAAKCPEVRGFRYLDDYELSCGSRSEAESVLAALQAHLSEYELRLNDTKTMIVELPDTLEDRWLAPIRDFTLDGISARRQASALQRFFDLAVETSKSWPREHVFQYCAGRLREMEPHGENVELLQNLVLGIMLAEPGVLPLSLALLQDLKLSGHGVPEQLHGALNRAVSQNSSLGHSSEVVWSLYGCSLFGIKLETPTCERLHLVDDDFVGLLALSLEQSGLAPGLTTDAWKSYANAGELFERHWLLAYELAASGIVDDGYLDEVPFFDDLALSGVRFFSQPDADAPIAFARVGGGSDGEGY